MENSNEKHPNNDSKTKLRSSHAGPAKFVFYIFVFAIGIFVAKGLFYVLENLLAKSDAKTKESKKIKAEQAKKPHAGQAQLAPPAKKMPEIKDTSKKTTPPELTLNGIASSGTERWAVINGRIVKAGDTTKGVKILRIYSDRVDLEFEGRKFSLGIY